MENQRIGPAGLSGGEGDPVCADAADPAAVGCTGAVGGDWSRRVF